MSLDNFGRSVLYGLLKGLNGTSWEAPASQRGLQAELRLSSIPPRGALLTATFIIKGGTLGFDYFFFELLRPAGTVVSHLLTKRSGDARGARELLAGKRGDNENLVSMNSNYGERGGYTRIVGGKEKNRTWSVKQTKSKTGEWARGCVAPRHLAGKWSSDAIQIMEVGPHPNSTGIAPEYPASTLTGNLDCRALSYSMYEQEKTARSFESQDRDNALRLSGCSARV
ncbi:hypothetical protein EDB87DRAFT_1581789 [Lactarius vividus]|nr:hypothetical protein EDB87DRAFT_1581789 [Lactarius vividus]